MRRFDCKIFLKYASLTDNQLFYVKGSNSILKKNWYLFNSLKYASVSGDLH